MLQIYLVCAALFDLKSYKVPNWYIFIGFLLGFFSHFLEANQQFLLDLSSAALFLICSIPLFLFHVVGGADLKLFSIVFFFLGPQKGIYIFCASFFLAASMAVLVLLRHILVVYSSFKKQNEQCNYWLFLGNHKTKKLHFSFYILLATLMEFLHFYPLAR